MTKLDDGEILSPWGSTIVIFAEGGMALNMNPLCYSYYYIEQSGSITLWSTFTRVLPLYVTFILVPSLEIKARLSKHFPYL